MRLPDCQSHSVISLSIIGNRLMLLIITKQHVSYNETILLYKLLNSYPFAITWERFTEPWRGKRVSANESTALHANWRLLPTVLLNTHGLMDQSVFIIYVSFNLLQLCTFICFKLKLCYPHHQAEDCILRQTMKN